ncbi:hypothetical protein THIOM_003968 [Candidatus Thiomargarita nelsonii]|uniref:Uncharacterized protein n=1 Tax=Candidatus Thiomargarita nelsonii TaxID=1003181 RepID=A0A176RXC0_9GAMM|nr:hypothetical protein THIOM_003968 [Candidatus Thiomargarita nelsonii]
MYQGVFYPQRFPSNFPQLRKYLSSISSFMFLKKKRERYFGVQDLSWTILVN